ncbi:AbrB/MazE/SpoVT family DNA-binding domain-containing protein [Candidatus Pacearchaeota archaeon]|nr:AbrB/MazE/SpoVT family DNA-binding domain-containing protein [Candidatus Pacearchaeota archaeon]
MAEIIQIGRVSSRGQIAIPVDVRRALGLEEGEKLMFVLDGDVLTIRKISKSKKSWEELTGPLREVMEKSGIKEEEVVELIHKHRKLQKKK